MIEATAKNKSSNDGKNTSGGVAGIAIIPHPPVGFFLQNSSNYFGGLNVSNLIESLFHLRIILGSA